MVYICKTNCTNCIERSFHKYHNYLHSISNKKHILFATYIYKYSDIPNHTLAKQLRHRLRKLWFPRFKSILIKSTNDTHTIAQYIHQQFERICHKPLVSYTPFVRPFESHIDTTKSIRLRITLQYASGMQPKQIFHITTHSKSEQNVRNVLANYLHTATDQLSIFIHESTPSAQCTLHDNRQRLPLWVTLVDIHGKLLLRFHTSVYTKASLSLTMQMVMNHRRVRLWVCATANTSFYTHVVPFLHTQLIRETDLEYVTHLQANDTLCCIVATTEQVKNMHRLVDVWIDIKQTQTEQIKSTSSTCFGLEDIYNLRTKMYTEEYTQSEVLHTSTLHWTLFQQHLMSTWIEEIAFVYRILYLRKRKLFQHWLILHSTLMVNALWNDSAYHTRAVFENCARALGVSEWKELQYIIDYWDIWKSVSFSKCSVILDV